MTSCISFFFVLFFLNPAVSTQDALIFPFAQKVENLPEYTYNASNFKKYIIFSFSEWFVLWLSLTKYGDRTVWVIT